MVFLLLLAGVAVAAASLLTSQSQRVTSYQIRPGQDLFGTLEHLRAGDHVVIHAGTYRTPGFLQVRWAGTARAPIVISGATGEPRPVIVGTPSQNVIDITGSHFSFSHIELRGGSHGVRLADVTHATLADLVVHDLGDVGISCDRPGTVCDAVAIRDSEIYDVGHDGTGEGLYLGCQSADCVFRNGEVQHNVIHDTGPRKGDGIQIKPGSSGNTVRDNLVYRTLYPGVTIWGCHDPRRRSNLVEGNVLRMTGGLWIMGRAVVRGNTVIGGRRRFSAHLPCRQVS